MHPYTLEKNQTLINQRGISASYAARFESKTLYFYRKKNMPRVYRTVSSSPTPPKFLKFLFTLHAHDDDRGLHGLFLCLTPYPVPFPMPIARVVVVAI